MNSSSWIRLVCAGALGMAAGWARPAVAQEAEFARLTPRDGLSSDFAEPILQDRNGYIWIGTGAGLDRYDGYTVRSYVHDPRDSTSIAAGVLSLLEAESGHLWVGTYRGLDRFDPATGRFTHIALDRSVPEDSLFMLRTWALHRDAQGTLWVGTVSGLFAVHDAEGNRITRYRHEPGDPASLSHSNVRDMIENEDGTFWIGTQGGFPSPPGGGLDRFDPVTGRVVQRYRHDPADPTSLIDDRIWDLHRDRQGTLWIGTRGGLCRMDEEEGTFACLRAGPGDPNGLSDSDIQAIEEDEDGRLWLGTGQGGVNVFDPATGTVVRRYRHDPANPLSLAEDDVHTILRDRFGTYWFTHHFGGVSRMTPDRVRFETRRPVPQASAAVPVNHVVDSVEEPNGVLWVATEYGLLRHDPAADTTEHFLPFPEAPFTTDPEQNRNLLIRIVEDRQGRLWTSTPIGDLLVFDRTRRAFKSVVAPVDTALVMLAFLDAEGLIWGGTLEDGLWRIDPQTEVVTRYSHDPQNAQSLGGEGAMPFLDAAGHIWVALNDKDNPFSMYDESGYAVQQYDRERDAFVTRPLPLPEGAAFTSVHMFPEEPGVFWLFSHAGLFRADARAGEVHHYPRGEHGLPGQVNALERDAEGRLWFGSWSGEFGMFDPTSGTITRYYAEDGVRIDRFLTSRRAPSGEMTFMGFGGFMRFHPDALLRDAMPPAVHVTGLRVAGTEQEVPAEGNPLRLAHDQHTLTFDYVGLHYDEPLRNRYRYRLEGFEESWVDAGGQRMATYTNLAPGRYAFRVQAAGSDGVWNEEGAAVSFVIAPPWWRTWWAYTLYALLFAAAVFAVDRLQRRRLLARERERARERELEQAREVEKAYHQLREAKDRLVQQEKLASLGALTAGIAHEIKNPLNFVNNFSALSAELVDELKEALAQGDTEEVEAILTDLKTNATKIEEHGKRADAIVRSMMQHARGGTGARETVDLNRFVDEYVDLAWHGRRAQQPGFNVDLVRDYGAGVGSVEVVPQDLGRVLINLFGNAFDAVSEQKARLDGQYAPQVRITTRQGEDGQVVIRVADNGGGIPASVREKIFEPFFTTKPTGSGTGLGLSMSYDIVTQGHGGTLTVESAGGQGAQFEILLPVTKAGDARPVMP